uniref:Gas vesicle protein n=1 Tax=Cyanothece sp. (strain PCC 7425 / ATCC 29141) TaxID=395961 RepID=B8HYJ2_CYAP4
MDNRSDRFAGGFLAGTLFGGIVGSFLGAFLATRLADKLAEENDPSNGKSLESKTGEGKTKKRPSFKPGAELTIEEARQELESKIAQLNEAIDDVRQQLSTVSRKS